MVWFRKENDYFPLLNAWTTDTWVCSLVRPRIHKICPARGFLSESKESNRSSPKLIASVYSSGCPRPHLREHKRTHTKGERERRSALVDHTPRAVVKSRDTPQPNPSNSLSSVHSIPFRSLTNEWADGRKEGSRGKGCGVSSEWWLLGLGDFISVFFKQYIYYVYMSLVFGMLTIRVWEVFAWAPSSPLGPRAACRSRRTGTTSTAPKSGPWSRTPSCRTG